MAQARPEEKPQERETHKMETKDSSNRATSGSYPFKFNAHAPEFVPRTITQVPVSGYFYPYFQFLGGSDWFYFDDQDPMHLVCGSTVRSPNYPRNVLTDDLRQKIIKQVEYHFSDIGLLATESLSKHMNKDPEAYVPISAIASMKKVKSLTSNHRLIAQALVSSSKLVVSNDNKKVKRKQPFTDKDKEELQSRTVVAENLPEDHSHHGLQKIFSTVGRVKTIRICQPQESYSSRSKGDFVISNKLHALVEYDTSEIAERAVEKLNDEGNWRKGLRVRLLLRCSPKSILKSRKSDFDGIFDYDETPSESAESSLSHNSELVGENNAEENAAGTRKGLGRGHGKALPRTQSQSHNGRGVLTPSPKSGICDAPAKHATKGPRMPDGTRGFTMGRGKPISTRLLDSSNLE